LLDYVKNWHSQPKPEMELQRPEGYHLDYRRNGTEDEFIICAPDGRHMAYTIPVFQVGMRSR
jgi:hypothetical protein